IRAAYGVDATILPHGVDAIPPSPEQVAACRERWHLLAGQTTALTVNQLHPRKRLDLLLRAVALARAGGLDLRVLIAGAGAARAGAEGGPLEILRDGETGLLVPPTSRAIAEAIAQLGRDPESARTMGARARADVTARYRWEEGAARLLRVLSAES